MKSESNQSSPDFVLLKTCTPAEAVSLLVDRFPIMLDLGESLDELKETGPFYAYDRFGAEVTNRANDEEFLRQVCLFIDELAASKDLLLEDVLVVSLLETFAEDPAVAAKVEILVGEKARMLLKDIEQKIYER